MHYKQADSDWWLGRKEGALVNQIDESVSICFE
jgi:hypothetical protein